MEIRPYHPGEEAAVFHVLQESTRVSFVRDYHPDLIARWSADRVPEEWRERLAIKQPYVALIEGQIVGFGEIEPSGFLDCFYVLAPFQGRGVGKALMAQIEAQATEWNVPRIYANVSVTARPFFEARGFVVTEEMNKIILGHPAPQFKMEKVLP